MKIDRQKYTKMPEFCHKKMPKCSLVLIKKESPGVVTGSVNMLLKFAPYTFFHEHFILLLEAKNKYLVPLLGKYKCTSLL